MMPPFRDSKILPSETITSPSITASVTTTTDVTSTRNIGSTSTTSTSTPLAEASSIAPMDWQNNVAAAHTSAVVQTFADMLSPEQIGASSGSSTSTNRFFGTSTSRSNPSSIFNQVRRLRIPPILSSSQSLLKRQKRGLTIERTIHLPQPVNNNNVTANPPLPPNWNENMTHVFESLASYKLFRISSSTSEFQKIFKLLDPLVVNEVEQIVNPTVWTRFVNARKEMLKAKCNDPTVLKELGLSDNEIARKQQSLNFGRHNAIDASSYNDNFAILYHCTRERGNLENILRDGFDERMGQGGTLGRGIYFSDQPMKSICYDGCDGVIFICGVLLGDCLADKSIPFHPNVVKEPEKLTVEKRFIDDNYFDSVAAFYANQYAVYNRYQCCPLYKVNFSRPEEPFGSSCQSILCHGTTVPPFAWIPGASSSIDSNKSASWPFFAQTIFDEIETMRRLEPFISCSAAPTQGSVDGKKPMNVSYSDAEMNVKKPNINDALKPESEPALKPIESESESVGSSYHSSTDEDEPKERRRPTTVGKPKKATVKSLPEEPLTEDCSICCYGFLKTSENWRTLRCQHVLCVNCFRKIVITRTTMTGVSHTFVKCPFCILTDGTEIGICPDGEMSEKIIQTHCDGYEDCNTILIEYRVTTRMRRMTRIAFLPDNEEGRNILNLLRIAWNRRLSLTIGTSHTTGVENTLVWNIHHKTSQTGGVYRHGYPDPTYFQRVIAELKSFGIE